MLGKALIKLGVWFERHFPEKLSVDEVQAKLASYEKQFTEATEVVQRLAKAMEDYEKVATAHGVSIAELAKKVEVLTSESGSMKAAMALRTKIASSIPIPGR